MNMLEGSSTSGVGTPAVSKKNSDRHFCVFVAKTRPLLTSSRAREMYRVVQDKDVRRCRDTLSLEELEKLDNAISFFVCVFCVRVNLALAVPVGKINNQLRWHKIKNFLRESVILNGLRDLEG